VPDSSRAQTVAKLRCLRGTDTLSAAGLATEIGDFQRFQHAGQLMSYLGLGRAENSSGEVRRKAPSPRRGPRHARRRLVEVARHYPQDSCPRHHPAAPPARPTRQHHRDPLAAQRRLYNVWRRLADERGKRRTIVAVARELAGFCWALARAD
jgi:transposase